MVQDPSVRDGCNLLELFTTVLHTFSAPSNGLLVKGRTDRPHVSASVDYRCPSRDAFNGVWMKAANSTLENLGFWIQGNCTLRR
jgi:hypothetical protein